MYVATTFQYKPFTMRSKKGSNLHFLLCDTPGLEDNFGLEAVEANFLLDGHVPEFYEVYVTLYCNK